jgi:hypothetical protein
MPFGINIIQGGATVRSYDYVRLSNAQVDFGNTSPSGIPGRPLHRRRPPGPDYVTQPPARNPPAEHPLARGPRPRPVQRLGQHLTAPLHRARGQPPPSRVSPPTSSTEEAIAWIDQTFRDPGPLCYANCDGSTLAPVLNVNDFICFNNLYATGSSLANCDGSTIAPALNVNDFTCFLNQYAAGCP